MLQKYGEILLLNKMLRQCSYICALNWMLQKYGEILLLN